MRIAAVLMAPPSTLAGVYAYVCECRNAHAHAHSYRSTDRIGLLLCHCAPLACHALVPVAGVELLHIIFFR